MKTLPQIQRLASLTNVRQKKFSTSGQASEKANLVQESLLTLAYFSLVRAMTNSFGLDFSTLDTQETPSEKTELREITLPQLENDFLILIARFAEGQTLAQLAAVASTTRNIALVVAERRVHELISSERVVSRWRRAAYRSGGDVFQAKL